MKSDGTFVIQTGQGITQSIAQEIGLNQEQIKKIDKSVWSAILDEVAKEKEINPNLYSGGSDITGKNNSNFVVNAGQTITISLKNVWNKILTLINNALGTDFEAEEINENENNINEKTITTVTVSNQQLEEYQKMKQQVIERQKELGKSPRNPDTDMFYPEVIEEYNMLDDKLSEYINNWKAPEQKDELLQIKDENGNIVLTYKAIIKSSGGLGWIPC